MASLVQMEKSGRNYHKVGFKRAGEGRVERRGGESDGNKQVDGVVAAITRAPHRLSVRYPEVVRRVIYLQT